MSDPQPNQPFRWTQEPWGRALRCTAIPVPHLFTSRDVALRDDPGEWSAVAASLGIASERLLLIRQVHGIQAAIARGVVTWVRPQADILATDDPTVAIGVRVADCAPILLYDAVRNVAGAAHSGWRGTAAGAAGAAVRAMQEEFGSSGEDLIAAIGPCLGRCCGEVGPEVVEAFRACGAAPRSMSAWFTPGSRDRSYLDLETANRDQLLEAGLRPETIFASGLCTRTHSMRLHSYRAEGTNAGRLLGAIRVRH